MIFIRYLFVRAREPLAQVILQILVTRKFEEDVLPELFVLEIFVEVIWVPVGLEITFDPLVVVVVVFLADGVVQTSV